MRIIYQIVSKKLKDIAKKDADKLEAMYDEADKFAKEVGAIPKKYYVSSGFGRKEIVAMKFKKEPDLKLWRKHGNCEGLAYLPTRKSKAAKELGTRMNKFKWRPTEIVKALKWEDIMHENTYHTFSMAFNISKSIFTFSAPALDDKKKRYKPVPGLKEISYGEYEKMIGG